MQNLITTDVLTHFTELVKTTITNPNDLPLKICEYLITQLDYNAVVFFTLDDRDNFIVQGKAGSAKESFSNNATFQCRNCRSINSNNDNIAFNNVAECEIQASDIVIYEGCLFINLNEKDRVLLKIAKHTPFSKTDKEIIETLGKSLKELLIIWKTNLVKNELSLGQVVTDIAHELRTPTNSILGFASLLNEDNLTNSQAEYVSTLKENAFNLLTLINDLIELAKVEQKIIKRNLTTVNLSDFLNEIIKLFSSKIEKNKIEFLIKLENGVPSKLKIDTQKFRYILVNILTQSVRLTEKGKITLTVSKNQKNKLSLRISDTSPGIQSEKLKNLFKPFSMESLENSKFGNVSGLGLAISKKYIDILDGNINVTSSVGKGTNYELSITVEDFSQIPSSTIEKQIISLPKPGKNNHVLVVEDDYATSKLLSNYLTKWGYVPVIVNSAEQTLKIIEKESFLSILMDIELPDSNGFELLKTLRENKATKNTPVIVCSVEAEQQKAFLMGAVEYFVKPINYKFLVEVLQSYKLKRDSNILIVDDDVPTLNLLKEAVEQLGFNAIAEAHSSKVPDMITSLDLDLAIIDLEMPELSGYELIKQIKSDSKFRRLPIIIYTGKENYKDELKNIDGMFEELLHKSSVNIEELSETISAMINRYEEPSKPEEIAAEKDTVKILLVEDYKHSQIIVTRLLKKNSFESIVVVENGAEALEQVKKQNFHLILMDMQMPVMNGFEATEKIRQIPEYKDTPIIALTAFAMKGDREKCLEAGATDYIPKPIDSQEFIEKVKHYTEAKINAHS
jgi:CheY-like chemotaxis protein/signal transduction histidine kinase